MGFSHLVYVLGSPSIKNVLTFLTLSECHQQALVTTTEAQVSIPLLNSEHLQNL